MNLTAQLFGVGAMVSLFLIYQQKTRRGMLLSKLSADVFWVIHYLLLGGWAGLIPNAVGIFRELVFLHRKQKKWAASPFWPILFILINWGLGLRTFDAAYDLLPLIASTCVTVSLWIDAPALTKIISLPVSAAFAIYDGFIGSYVGIFNESLAILSITINFAKNCLHKGGKKMKNHVFSADIPTEKELVFSPGAPIEDPVRIITSEVSDEARALGARFAEEIERRFVGNFERPEDKMAHVSTFTVQGGIIYMSYYANTHDPSEDPKNQTARLAYAPVSDPTDVTYLDLQATGDTVDGKTIDMVYDTILMPKDADTLYLLWTARTTDENYYRFYRTFTPSAKALGDVGVNRFRVGDVTNDFSASGIRAALAANSIPCKKMFSDIGIMQKMSSRIENGTTYYYTGTYSGDFTCVIKSADLVTWEYVSQPDFINDSMWENATYVKDDKVYYFVRQQWESKYGFLTYYDLTDGTWARPVLIEDCQSRGDFIEYGGALYLFHAPIDREHIGIVRIDTEDIAQSRVILQAKMKESCFYPFIERYTNGDLAMSYTMARLHIRLAAFDPRNYLK